MVCFLCLALSELVVAAGGSNVKVALVLVGVSFLNRTVADGTTASNPGNKAELGSLGQEEWFLWLHTTDISVLCTEAITARNITRLTSGC